MPTIEVADDDLVVVIPRDVHDTTVGVKVFVGSRPVSYLQELSIHVGITEPAKIQALWPVLEPGAIRPNRSHGFPGVWPINARSHILASQALMAPWLEAPVVERKGPTLWDLLGQDEG